MLFVHDCIFLWQTRAAQDLVQTLLVQSPQLRTLELALRYLNTLCLTAEQVCCLVRDT